MSTRVAMPSCMHMQCGHQVVPSESPASMAAIAVHGRMHAATTGSDLGRRAPFIDVVAPGCARVLMSARSRWSHVLAVSSSFKHILYSSPAGAFTEYTSRAPIGSVFPAGTVAQRFGRDLLVVVLHLLSHPSCRREVGASWTDVAVTLVAGIGGPAAEAAGLVARPSPLGEMARVVAQLGCDHGLHQHVPLRVQSVPVVGGVNVLVDTAM